MKKIIATLVFVALLPVIFAGMLGQAVYEAWDSGRDITSSLGKWLNNKL